jgi:hypothetical protein
MISPLRHWPFRKFARPFRAMRLCRKARQDEENGFLFAAAMEWREAAGLCAHIGSMADRCWQEWERLMQLPRGMAEPIPEMSVTNLGRTAA